MLLKNSFAFTTFLFLAIGLGSCGTEVNQKENKTSINQKDTTNMKSTEEIIVDVRTPEEWEFDGHANCSVNYPLDELMDKVEDLKKYQHIVLVCRSGARAGVAKRQLENAGLNNIENLGPWQNVNCAN